MKRSLFLALALMLSLPLPRIFAATFGEEATSIPDGVSASVSAAASTTVVAPVEKNLRFRVAGYNIAHARGGKVNSKNPIYDIGRKKNLEAIGKLLRDNKIDILCATEISNGDLRAGMQKQPERLAKMLGNFHHSYGQNVKVGWGGFIATQGNAVISRFPILGSKNHTLYQSVKGSERRGCLEVLLDLGKAGKLRVLVAHLSLIAEESDKQVEEIWKLAEKSAEPVLLAGDFNSRPRSNRIKWLSERMTDTTANINSTYGNIPDVKIDYHFIKGPVSAGTARVAGLKEKLSDHGCLINDYWISIGSGTGSR